MCCSAHDSGVNCWKIAAISTNAIRIGTKATKLQVWSLIFGTGISLFRLIIELGQAKAVIADAHADAVSLARAMLYDPRWPWHAAAELEASVAAPKQYLHSQPRE